MFELNKKDRSDADAKVFSNKDRADDSVVSQNDTLRPAENLRRDVAVIGRSIRISGDLQGDEDVRIEGDVTGTIRLVNNTLTIGSEGKIHADVYAKSVTVDGLMEGDLYGSEQVSIRKSAQVHGNVTAPRVSLEDGARFKGSIEMDPEVAAAAVAKGEVAESSTATHARAEIAATPKQVAGAKSNGGKPVKKPETASGKETEKHDSAAG
jgi:cytoskeletal protein CcmA (bactofilin family)